MRIGAIDQGTTSTRLLVVDHDGSCHLGKPIKHAQKHPQPGWVEHDPLELLANIRNCLAGGGTLDALGIDNQGESCLAWNAETREPISPVIVWQDSRTAKVIDRLKGDGAESETLRIAGLPLDAYFSASKLRWLFDNVPEATSLHRNGKLRLGTTDAFFLHNLSGICATDITTASRTSLMNLETGSWDPTLCTLFGVPIDCLPEIRPTMGEFGAIDGVPVTAAAVDQQAALYGHDCRKTGDAKITFGTGAFALAVTGAAIVRAPERGLLPTVAWDSASGGRAYAVDGGVYNAGSAVDWMLSLGLVPDLAVLTSFDAAPAIERGLAFVPALSGLACPHWDRSAAGLWIGMGLDTAPRDLAQSVLEGIALRTAEVLAAMDTAVPLGPRISVDGGLSRSPYFLQFLADASGRTLIVRDFDELTVFGCASLAATALNHDLILPAAGQRVIAPQRDGTAWREKFSDAVGRAKAWR